MSAEGAASGDEIKGWRCRWSWRGLVVVGGGGSKDEADAVSRVGVPWMSGGKLKGEITYKST